MPVWEEQELEDCRQLIYSNVTKEKLSDNFANWGGIIRFTLAQPEFSESKEILQNSIDKTVAQFPSLYDSVGRSSAAEGSSHYILQIHTQSPYRHRQLTFGSMIIAEKIAYELFSRKQSQLLAFLDASHDIGDYGSLRGYMFEGLVHNLLSRDGTFDVRSLERRLPNEKLIIVPQRNGHPTVFKDLAELNGIIRNNPNPPSYFRPKSKTYCGVDSILFHPTFAMVQITISKDHPIKMQGVVDILKDIFLPPSRSSVKYRFYFVVPESIYDDFRKQSYLTTESKVATNINSLITDNVEQWVMKIDFTRLH